MAKRKPLTKKQKKYLSDYWRGRKFSPEHLEKIRKNTKRGDEHHAFSEKASLASIHRYVRKRHPPNGVCSECKKESSLLDLANISGNYTRDFNDYRYLCRKCHQLSDGRLNNLTYNKKELKKKSILKLSCV